MSTNPNQLRLFWSCAWALAALSCATPTHHPTRPARLGTPRSTQAMVDLLFKPSPVRVETVASADWEVPLSGLLNIEHEKAKAAGKVDGPEPIIVPFHVIRHPTRGAFIVDTGVERAIKNKKKSAVRGVVRTVMNVDEKLIVHRSLGAFLADEPDPIAGVFLTHLHPDHVMGLPDVPRGTPILAGPGENADTSFQNLIVGPNIDRMLKGHRAIREWQYAPDADGVFDGVLDVFGDGTVWAIWVPGHTPGSTAYLVRTQDGPVLLTGDACHTRWGWDNGVEPGSFSGDPIGTAESFHKLQAFVAAHPGIEVRVGHQR